MKTASHGELDDNPCQGWKDQPEPPPERCSPFAHGPVVPRCEAPLPWLQVGVVKSNAGSETSCPVEGFAGNDRLELLAGTWGKSWASASADSGTSPTWISITMAHGCLVFGHNFQRPTVPTFEFVDVHLEWHPSRQQKH